MFDVIHFPQTVNLRLVKGVREVGLFLVPETEEELALAGLGGVLSKGSALTGAAFRKTAGLVTKMPGVSAAAESVARHSSKLIEALHLRKVIASASVWLEPAVMRGLKIEKMLGQNLPHSFKVVDRWDEIKGIVTSIKSTNLFCKTYQDPKKLGSLLKRYVDKVAEFKGDQLGKRVIESSDIKTRGLDLALPHSGTLAQQKVLQEIADYAASQNVLFNMIIIP